LSADPVFAPLRRLGEMIRAGAVSPVQLAEAFLHRLETLGPRYNAVVTLTRERAMDQARRAERELAAGRDFGPLHGIPYGAKDLLATSGGIPTSWGAAPLKDQRFDEDATVIRKLEAAGAVLCAKLAMVELAGGMGYRQPHASFTGPGISPWHADAWSGGSSSGSGSAVAAGLVPFAIGSETWGSIVTPAAFCGISGLRPTYGRVSRRGAMALSWTLDKLGPMCRTADDCGLVLEAIAGHDPGDPTSGQQHFRYPDPTTRISGFRIGVLGEKMNLCQDAVRENFDASLDVLRDFATLEDAELPDLPYNEVAGVIIQAELSSLFEELMTSGDVRQLTAPEDRINGLASMALPASVYLRALRIRRKISDAMDELCAKYDALVAPTLPNVASPIDQDFNAYFARANRSPLGGAANAAGLPGIAIPNGFGERGLPTSLSITGRAWSESTLLAIANAVQQRTDWHTKRAIA
jgi:aspartyl-tRNA(Asn)/glutamyl-tRNA(Gln) amidotransferase subunit A